MTMTFYTGENVIYVGKCFDETMNDFIKNADFFGHLGADDSRRVLKMKDWLFNISNFLGGHSNVTISSQRISLMQNAE
jgi:hypothetical protein